MCSIHVSTCFQEDFHGIRIAERRGKEESRGAIVLYHVENEER